MRATTKMCGRNAGDAMHERVFYAAGGRTVQTGPYQGVGRDNPNKSASIRGFTITPAQRADRAAFLESLTDTALLDHPQFANPWPAKRSAAAK